MGTLSSPQKRVTLIVKIPLDLSSNERLYVFRLQVRVPPEELVERVGFSPS